MKLPKIKVGKIGLAIAILIVSFYFGSETSEFAAGKETVNDIFHAGFFVVSIVAVYIFYKWRKLKKRTDY